MWYLYLSEPPHSHLETDCLVTYNCSARDCCVIPFASLAFLSCSPNSTISNLLLSFFLICRCDFSITYTRIVETTSSTTCKYLITIMVHMAKSSVYAFSSQRSSNYTSAALILFYLPSNDTIPSCILPLMYFHLFPDF